MSDEIKFETFLDAQGAAFQEYVSTITAELPKTDPEYRAIRDSIGDSFKQYPHVEELFDSGTAAALTEQECEALIKIMSLQSRLTEIETQMVYLRGCYDGVGYLKKAGIL